MNHIRHESGSHPHGFQLFRALPLLIAVLLCLPIGLKAAVSADIASASQQVTKTVTVSIKDVVGPLAGANVSVKGTKNGANTDSNGKVTLANVPANSTLVISYMGYKTQEISVSVGTSFEVVLEEDTNMLDELVVIGYGTVRKRDLTGSVSSVKSKELTAFTVSNPIQALQGRVPGVTITTNNGAPTGNFSIRVRGSNSIRGDNGPLYIIDGMPANVSSVNSYDIESVEVLKDASATAIYGSRGANGVILITTKSGRTGKTNVQYNFEYGIQTLRKKMDMMNAKEYMEFYNIQQMNDKGVAYFTDAQIAAAGKGYDWQDAVYRDASVQNHNISVAGGNEKTRFSVSGSAMLREGIIKTSEYNKYNLRSVLDHDVSNWLNVAVRMGYTYTTRQDKASSDFANRGGSIVSSALLAPPTLSPYNEDGSYQNLQLAYPFISNALVNPINLIDRGVSKTEANLLDLSTALTFKPFKGFSFKISFGLENNDYRGDKYVNSKNIYGSTSASVGFTRNTTVINENIVNYDFEFGDAHSLNLMGGFTYQQNVSKYLGGSGSGFLSDATETYNLASAATPGIPSSSYSKWVLMSYLARANYSYKGKYLLTASIRADGSSRYSEGDKWGYFPSAAAAWSISEEPWLKGKTSISNLKLRIGYGVTGSTAIGPYATMNMLSSGSTPLGGDGVVTFFTPSTTYPGALKWESTSQTNVGVDMGLFNDRLRITADAYYKLTTDLLNSVNLPPSSGYGSTIRNIGKMSNRGLELLVEGEILNTKDWSWTASANIATNKNEVKKLAGGPDIYGSNVSMVLVNGTVNLIREGEPMGVFYVFKSDGYDENGTLKYVDADENGTLTNDDRFILGNPHPDFTYGLNTEIAYKRLSLSMFWVGSQGNDVYNVSKAQYYDYGMGLNMLKEVYKSHWDQNNTPEQNAKAKYPKIRANQNIQQSDIFIEDGSYVRLKNIQLGYTIPVLKRYINKIHVYVSAQNILTFTKYSGADPEVNSYGSDMTIGIDWFPYPMNKSITLGANIQF